MDVQLRALLKLLLTACILMAPVAEAKRAGGGKSVGMSRSSNTQAQQYNTAPPTAPSINQNTTNASNSQQQRTGSSTGKMLAAGVAGAAVGAVAVNALANERPASTVQAQQPTQHAQGLPSWLWLILIAGLAFLIFRKFATNKSAAQTNPYAPNASAHHASGHAQSDTANSFPLPLSHTGDNTNIFGQAVGSTAHATAHVTAGVYTQSSQQLPDGTQPAAFLRIARQRFNHIQAINNASNLQEIQRYLTPELYQQMQQDIMANRDQDVAEFSNLNAMLANSSTENTQYVVSVRFTGMVSEDLNSPPQPFSEIWNFVKPADSNQDWLVAGIEQI